MAEHQENSSKFLSVSDSEKRDSIFSDAEAFEGDEEFYEEIEAPKFVDFTVPNHYCPDDRYWFCDRVGCDQKHEEEMDSEAIYKKFVLRVMAARSPNVRLRKIFDRNTLRKCPLSAPPKPSKPRLSKMDIVSSFSKKTAAAADEKVKVVKPVPEPRSTPVMKTKQVAAKYLTTPRHKNCTQNENSFRSVRNPKPTDTEVPNGRMVAKALVFHSPKKRILKVKTSVELRTPVSKLCQGINKLEIKSSSSLSKPGKSVKSKIERGTSLLQQKAALMNEDIQEIEQEENREENGSLSKPGKTIKSKICRGTSLLQQKVALKNEDIQEIKQEENREENGLEQEVSDEDSRSEHVNGQENNIGNGNENVDNLSEAERDDEFMDGDNNKENATATDENRMHNEMQKQNGRMILAVKEQSGQVRKKVTTQAPNKNVKESLVVKLKKPKATNPRPFRLRTDERGILKETKLEKLTNCIAPQTESVTLSTLSGKLQMKKQGTDTIQGLKIPKGQERSKPAAAVVMPEIKKQRDGNAMQRLEKFRKTSCSRSPLQKHSIRPTGPVSTKKELASFLIPGQKLDVILENSPEVLELKRAGKTITPSGDEAPASRLSSQGKRPMTAAGHVPRTCTKKLK